MFEGTINEVLFEIAKQLGLQWNELTQYANEAPYAATRPVTSGQVAQGRKVRSGYCMQLHGRLIRLCLWI
jgi:hypothetical protein